MIFESSLPRTITAEFSPAYERQKEEWKMVNTLLSGTNAIRIEAETYLPKNENESTKQYRSRLDKSVLTPFFKRAINFFVGKAFYKGIRVEAKSEKGEISEKLRLVLEDANRKGDDLGKFSNMAFKDALSKGVGYLYVEAPRNTAKNRAQELKNGIRPYLLYFKPEDVLDVAMDENGNIIYCKLLERYSFFDEGDKKTKETTRLRIVTEKWIGVYEKDTPGADANEKIPDTVESDVYRLTSESMENKLGIVPLIPIYTGEKRTDFDSASPFIDLAYTNIQYYQDESTHENAIAYAEFPLLVLIGADGSDVNIGPKTMLTLPEIGSDLKYVEHSGAALEAGRKNLEELRNKMGYCGLKVLMSDSANGGRTHQTATEAEIESVDSNSELKVAADNFVDSLNLALWYVQLYNGELKSAAQGSKYNAVLDGIFSITQNDIQEIGYLLELNNEGKIRLETLFGELKRRGTLAENFDVESEAAYAEENAEYPLGA